MLNQTKLLLKLSSDGFLRCCFCIFLVLFIRGQAQCGDANISVSLSCFREQIGVSDPNQGLPKLIPITEANSLDPVILKLIITNKSTKDISVLWPEFPGRTVVPNFRNKSDGKQIPPQVRWMRSGFSNDYITIPQSKNYEVLLYLEELYPTGILPGSYEMQIQYYSGYKPWLQTNSISLTIAPQSEEEKKQLSDYIRVVRTGGAELFLKENPESRFRSDVYIAIALNQEHLKNFDAASKAYDLIISDKKASTFQRNQAYWRKGHLLKKTGKLEEAIKCMEKAKFIRSAYRDAMKWKLVLTQPNEANPEGKSVLIFRIGVSRYRGSGEFYQGEPIFIHAGIRRTDVETNDIPRQETLRIGTEKLPWYKNISFYVYKLEEVPLPKAVPPSPTTTPSTPERAKQGLTADKQPAPPPTIKKTLLKNVAVKLVRLPSKKHKLKVNKAARSSWAIDPNSTSNLSCGKYVIEATFDTTQRKELHPHIFHGKYRSNGVIVVINKPEGDHVKAEVLVAQATYSGRHQKYDDQIKLLRQAWKLNPARGDIHCGLGRAYELKGDIKTAIREYRAYVEWVRSLNLPRTAEDDRNDHADIIERMVENMEQRRAKKREKANQ